MIALIVGPDAATARAAVSRILDQRDPGGLATARFDGKSATIDEFAIAAGTPGFFSGGRVIVVDGLMARFGRGAQGDERSGEAGGLAGKQADLARLFAAVLPENALVLVDASLASVPAVVKKAAPSDAVIASGEPPRGSELIAWIREVARATGAEIDSAASRALAEAKYPRTWSAKPTNPAYDRPPDLDALRNEVEKLAMFAHPDPIAVRHVREMIVEAAEDRLFPFIESVAQSRVGPALQALATLRDDGEDIGRAVAQLFQQAELGVIAAAGEGDPVQIGRDLGLSNPNRMLGVSRTIQTARVAPATMTRRATEIDRALKQGRVRQPEDQLYLMVAATAQIGDHEKSGR